MKKTLPTLAGCLVLIACSLQASPASTPTSLPTAISQMTAAPSSTFTAVPAFTQTPVPTQTTVATTIPAFCNDPQARELIASFSNAIATSNGELLASLISPARGMDVRFYRDGKVINYDVEHARFVFETTFQADWGLSFGSGQPTVGAFKDILLPSLKKVFVANAEVTCNQIKTGGTTYVAEWPYPYMDFYSVHFPGTDQYGGLDWETWLAGMDHVGGRPYIAALMHFVWEP